VAAQKNDKDIIKYLLNETNLKQNVNSYSSTYTHCDVKAHTMRFNAAHISLMSDNADVELMEIYM